MSDKDKLDILIYNTCRDTMIDRNNRYKLKSIAKKFNVRVDCLYNRYLWLQKMEIDPNLYHLDENHKLILYIFDKFNNMLNENDVEYYYTSGILSYLLADKDLERYHHDLDVFINMDCLINLEQICNKYDFSFERIIGYRKNDTKRIMLKMYYLNELSIPITVLMYTRQKDNSIIQKDYFTHKNGKQYVEYIYNSPKISELSFSKYPQIHNNIEYYSITAEALFLCKDNNRPKDIYDCLVFKDIVDINKLNQLKREYEGNLTNIIVESDLDEYYNFIFLSSNKRMVLKNN